LTSLKPQEEKSPDTLCTISQVWT